MDTSTATMNDFNQRTQDSDLQSNAIHRAPGHVASDDEAEQSRSETLDSGRARYRTRALLQTSLASVESEHASSSRLQNRLHKEIQSNRDGDFRGSKGYIPNFTLRQIMSLEAVESELRHWESFVSYQVKKTFRGREYIKIEALKICGQKDPALLMTALTLKHGTDGNESQNTKSYIKIMAILVMLERSLEIRSFFDEVSDDDLPLTKSKTISRKKHYELRRRSDPEKSLECFKGWSQARIDRFEEEQWKFLPAIFRKSDEDGVPHDQFHPAMILPFKSLSTIPDIKGGLSIVKKVRIHHECHSFEMNEVSHTVFSYH